MATPSPRQQIALWLALERAQHLITNVQVWDYQQSRMRYWPGADLHPVPTLVLCLQGRARVLTRAFAGPVEHCDLGPGEALLIAPSVCHEHRELHGENTVFDLGFVRESSDYCLFNAEARLLGLVPGQPYRQMLDGLFKLDTPGRCRGLAHLVQTFLDERRHTQEGAPPALEAMQGYLRKNAHLPITADDIVHASGLQAAQAYAVFQRFYAAPPFQVLQQRRIEIAMAHLRAGLAVQETALCSGFTSRRNLSRAFVRVRGEELQLWMRRELAAVTTAGEN